MHLFIATGLLGLEIVGVFRWPTVKKSELNMTENLGVVEIFHLPCVLEGIL